MFGIRGVFFGAAHRPMNPDVIASGADADKARPLLEADWMALATQVAADNMNCNCTCLIFYMSVCYRHPLSRGIWCKTIHGLVKLYFISSFLIGGGLHHLDSEQQS